MTPLKVLWGTKKRENGKCIAPHGHMFEEATRKPYREILNKVDMWHMKTMYFLAQTFFVNLWLYTHMPHIDISAETVMSLAAGCCQLLRKVKGCCRNTQRSKKPSVGECPFLYDLFLTEQGG